MRILNINGMQPVKDYFELTKKRSEPPNEPKGDRVEISPEAKKQSLAQPLLSIVKEYLNKIPAIREDRVENVGEKVNSGYKMDRSMLETISERILQNFQINE